MADNQRSGPAQRDIEQAITALKKGAYLLKYGRRGKPKFCPFRLSNDESLLIWYSGKEEKHLKISHVSKIIPGQCTAIFQQYPRPEKEYQSFSLLYGDRSLDLICKDKDEAEVWFVGLKALINRGNLRRWRSDYRCNSVSSDSPHTRTKRNSPSITPFDPGDTEGNHFENISQSRLGKAFSEILTYTAVTRSISQPELITNPSLSAGSVDNSNGRSSASDGFRISLSSAVSSSSQGSCPEDFDALGDVFIWGEGIEAGLLGGGLHRVGSSTDSKMDALLPKALESSMVLDIHGIACGSRHAVIVTRRGEVFSWGEESGGRLGHGVDADVSHPKIINSLSGMNIESVACGEYHTCAVTYSGDLYTWGGGTHPFGLLGHGSEVSHWIPKKVCGRMEDIHVSYISCGPWHTAVVTSAGQLFTFGDGSFGALGHGNRSNINTPREVETLRGQRITRVSCGVWHTAAVVEVINESSSSVSGKFTSGKLFTWGDGDKGRLGHGDKETRLVPECVVALASENVCQTACGLNLTVVLTTSGQVYTMGSATYGQLGSPMADGMIPMRVEGNLSNNFVEAISCGSYHTAVLTSKAEVYTWGKGSNGQLGHGDNDHRNTPTFINPLKDKQVKNVVCGSNFTAVICLHKWVTSVDHSICSCCHNAFGFRRKRHNCYNCGLVFCKACSSKKSLKASLAPNTNKPYRVCDECFSKLKKALETNSALHKSKVKTGSAHKSHDVGDRETWAPKFQGALSRLSSFGSLNNTESKHLKHDVDPVSHNNRIFTSFDGNLQLNENYRLTASKSSIGASKKVFSSSVPVSRLVSRATSPISGISSPYISSEELLHSKNTNESLSQEIIILRAQVESLTCQSQNLEAELARTSRQLKEVTMVAADEAEKCKSAKEVIKSLTSQLKEMAERLPEEQTGQLTVNLNTLATESNSMSMNTDARSNGNLTHPPNGGETQSGKGESVIQDEPGVYITLSPLPDGGCELKRVRFSRRRFTEEQAEKWWTENGAKVCERHNIRSTD